MCDTSLTSLMIPKTSEPQVSFLRQTSRAKRTDHVTGVVIHQLVQLYELVLDFEHWSAMALRGFSKYPQHIYGARLTSSTRVPRCRPSSYSLLTVANFFFARLT